MNYKILRIIVIVLALVGLFTNILLAGKSRHDVFGHHPSFDCFDTSVEYLQGKKSRNE